MYSVPSQDSYNVIIAAIPLMCLLAAAATFTLLLIRNWPHWAAIGKPPTGLLPASALAEPEGAGGKQGMEGGLLPVLADVALPAGTSPSELR